MIKMLATPRPSTIRYVEDRKTLTTMFEAMSTEQIRDHLETFDPAYVKTSVIIAHFLQRINPLDTKQVSYLDEYLIGKQVLRARGA